MAGRWPGIEKITLCGHSIWGIRVEVFLNLISLILYNSYDAPVKERTTGEAGGPESLKGEPQS